MYETSSKRLLGVVTVLNAPLLDVQKAPLLSPYLGLSENSSIHIISTPYKETSGQLSMPSNTLTDEKAWLGSLRKVLMEVFIHDWHRSVVGRSRRIRPGEIAIFGNRYDEDIEANVTVTAVPTANFVVWYQLALATQMLCIAAASLEDFRTTSTASIRSSAGEPIASVSIGWKYNPVGSNSRGVINYDNHGILFLSSSL